MASRNGNHSPDSAARVRPRRLIRLHPREDSFEVSQGRTVLSTNLCGFITPNTASGLFVYQTRILSCYRWLLDDKEPLAVALSNVEQHSWLGYYIQLPRSVNIDREDRGSGAMAAVSERSLELRLSRSVGYGVHEDVDLTNFTQGQATFQLELEVDADFADQEETQHQRQQFGDLERFWRCNQQDDWELFFDYFAHHHPEHQGDIRDASIHRSLTIEVENCSSEPHWSGKAITFQVSLKPLQSWHTCICMYPKVEEEPSFPLYGCYAFQPSTNIFDASRAAFLAESTQFSSPASETLTPVVVGALEQARHDLAALRLHDLDHNEHAWVPAAGIPIYLALFGRDKGPVRPQGMRIRELQQKMGGTIPTAVSLTVIASARLYSRRLM